MGIFLTGAYQDVLGSAHNLFGRVNEAHIEVLPGGHRVNLFVRGQKARKLIENMGYEEKMLKASLRAQASSALKREKLAEHQVAELLETYMDELLGYTYLE